MKHAVDVAKHHAFVFVLSNYQSIHQPAEIHHITKFTH